MPHAESIETVTGSSFQRRVLNAPVPIAVEFMSYGCAHCRAIEPVLQHVAELVEPGERVVRVNVAVETALAARYGIEGTPTLVMFRAATEVGRIEGPQPTVSFVLDAITQPFRS